MGLFRKSQMMVQRYEEYFIPPNKIANIFQLFSLQQNGHIAKLCEHPVYAQNYLYNTFYVQSGQVGRRGGSPSCYNVTMLHVTIPPTPSTSIPSPQPPCKLLLLSILQPKSHARRKPARLLSPTRVFTFVNKKPPSPTLFSAQKNSEKRVGFTQKRVFCGVGDCIREVKNRGATVAIAPNREGSKLSTSQIKGKVYRTQWPLGDESHLYRLY